VVYLGCGNAARYGEQLSNNCCLRHALRAHVANGGRIYAECAGLAYLCEDLVLDDSRHYRMLGILPAIAHYHANSAVGPKPVELTTANDCWLFGEGKRLRGYLNPHWVVKTRGQLPNLLADPTHSHDVIGFDNVVGSRLHINFAAQPSFLRSFGHGNA